jgi:hypothetical protein
MACLGGGAAESAACGSRVNGFFPQSAAAPLSTTETTAMEYLKSLTRHWLTWAFSAAVIWLVATFALPEADQTVLADAFAKITESVLVILVVLAPLVGRFVLTWISQAFRSGAGETENKTGSSGGNLPLWVCIGTLAGFMGLLPACSSAQWAAARAIPIRIGIQGPDAALNYSAKAGLELNAVIRAEK